VPHLRQGLPAVAQLLHWHLQQQQQQQQQRRLVRISDAEELVSTFTHQLQLLVEGAAAAALGQPLLMRPTKRPQQQVQKQPGQNKKKLKQDKKLSKQLAQQQGAKGAADELEEAAASGGSAGWELHLPQAARQQVRC
jgi:ADP-ribosylglycohydrolase